MHVQRGGDSLSAAVEGASHVGWKSRISGSWRLYSFDGSEEAVNTLYTHCTNELHRLLFRLANASL